MKVLIDKLPYEIRGIAQLRAIEKPAEDYDLNDLGGAFSWQDTKEGYGWWDRIYMFFYGASRHPTGDYYFEELSVDELEEFRDELLSWCSLYPPEWQPFFDKIEYILHGSPIKKAMLKKFKILNDERSTD